MSRRVDGDDDRVCDAEPERLVVAAADSSGSEVELGPEDVDVGSLTRLLFSNPSVSVDELIGVAPSGRPGETRGEFGQRLWAMRWVDQGTRQFAGSLLSSAASVDLDDPVALRRAVEDMLTTCRALVDRPRDVVGGVQPDRIEAELLPEVVVVDDDDEDYPEFGSVEIVASEDDLSSDSEVELD